MAIDTSSTPFWTVTSDPIFPPVHDVIGPALHRYEMSGTCYSDEQLDLFFQELDRMYASDPRFLMFFDLSNFSSSSSSYWMKIVQKFVTLRPLSALHLVATSIVMQSKIARVFVNGIIALAPNTKPMKIVESREEAQDFIAENAELEMIHQLEEKLRFFKSQTDAAFSVNVETVILRVCKGQLDATIGVVNHFFKHKIDEQHNVTEAFAKEIASLCEKLNEPESVKKFLLSLGVHDE